MDTSRLHQRTRQKGARLWVYWPIRSSIQVFCLLYFRMSRKGRQYIPATGPAIVVSNHRSFLDPFVVGTMARRPMYYVAKRELFGFNPFVAWLLSSVGSFPVARGYGDEEMMATAHELLKRGEIVLIFPEGTRRRPGPLGKARRGGARLAVETGVPVIPVAIIGTEAVRNGWRFRPHKVRAQAAPAMAFHAAGEEPSREEIKDANDQIWQAVSSLWEELGGESAVPKAPRSETATTRNTAN